MNISKFTTKSQEVVQECEKVAMDYGHQEMGEDHLLAAMLRVEGSLIPKLIEKMGIDADVFQAQVDGASKPRDQGIDETEPDYQRALFAGIIPGAGKPACDQ